MHSLEEAPAPPACAREKPGFPEPRRHRLIPTADDRRFSRRRHRDYGREKSVRDFSIAVNRDSYEEDGCSETTHRALDLEALSHAGVRLHQTKAARQHDGIIRRQSQFGGRRVQPVLDPLKYAYWHQDFGTLDGNSNMNFSNISEKTINSSASSLPIIRIS